MGCLFSFFRRGTFHPAELNPTLKKKKRDGEKLRDKAGTQAPTEKAVVESQAAVKIQASYRGYKTRKDLQKAKPEKGVELIVDKRNDEEIAADLVPPLGTIRESVEEEAAVKIQSGVRGFLTRRRLKAQRSLNNNNSIEEYVEPVSATQSPDISQENSRRSDPDEHDLAIERILKEYGTHPVPSFRQEGPKIESRTTSMEVRVQELEAELASVGSESRDNQDASMDKSESSAALEEPEPETALASVEVEELVAPIEQKSEVDLEAVLPLKSVDATDKAESVTTQESHDSNEPAIDSDSISHSEGSDIEQSYNVNQEGEEHTTMEKNSIQLINAVLIEAEATVKSMEEVKDVDVEPQQSESDNHEAANFSKEESQSEPRSPPEVIQVEISKITQEDDGIPKVSTSTEGKPVIIPAAVRKEPVESVPLRSRGREEQASEAPVVVRRSKRNTSNTETKYRSGFVEVSPDHDSAQKLFDKIAMPNIDESDLDREIETEVMNNAAAKIQAGFRGYKARRSLNKAKASATCIQANFRGYKARRKIEQEKNAVVKIQATVRGFLARRRIAKEKLANQSKRRKSSTGFKLQRRRSSTLNAAAIRIQSAYRGYTVRKNYKELRQNSTSPVDLRIEDVGVAQGDI